MLHPRHGDVETFNRLHDEADDDIDIDYLVDVEIEARRMAKPVRRDDHRARRHLNRIARREAAKNAKARADEVA